MISICIPTYEMHGFGTKYLSFSFDIMCKQTYKDFNVLISDHSVNEDIKNLCDSYRDRLDIIYVKNEIDRGNFTSNVNNSILHANGDILKLLMQDDFLRHNDSLKDIYENFNLETDGWLVTSCEITYDGINIGNIHTPYYNDNIHVSNSIGSPSVLSIKNIENKIFFDTNLIWLMDCEFYKRCNELWGLPKIVSKSNIVIRLHPNQVSNTQCTKELQQIENKYVRKKYNMD